MKYNFNQQNNNWNNNFCNFGMNFGMMNPNINVGMPNVFNNNGNNFVNNNILNQFNNNNQLIINQMNLKKKLFNESFNEKDPFKIQLKIALGLNNNMPYENCVAGGNKGFSFMKKSSQDNQPISKDNKINVIFKAMQGNFHNRMYDKNETIEGMLLKFLKSVGLNAYHYDKIYFIYNAINLSTVNQKQTLEKYGIKNNSSIVILDVNNIIGA